MKYKIFADYGRGKDLNKLIFYFKPEEHNLDERFYEISEKTWKKKLEEANKKGKSLYNANLLNFDGVKNFNDVSIVLTSPTKFSYYITARDLLDGKISEDIDLKEIEEKINPLSSFPSVITDDYFLMGIKGKQVEKASGALSFPGAGYLNVEKDTIEIEGNRIAKHPSNIVERELREEIGLESEEIKKIKAVAIAKDCYKSSHWSTALFSFIITDLSEDDIRRKHTLAEDSWEHKNLVFIPNDKKYIETLINSDIENKEIPYEIRKEIKGNIPEKISLTGKSRLMLFYLGRYFESEDWFEEKLSEYGIKLITYYTTK